MFFGAIVLLPLGLFFLCAMLRHGYQDTREMFAPLVPLSVLIIIGLTLVFSINLIFTVIHYEITSSHVKYEKKNLFGIRSWKEPITNYTLLPYEEFFSNSDSLYQTKYYSIQLDHPDRKKRVVLYEPLKKSEQNLLAMRIKAEEYADLLKLHTLKIVQD